MHSSHLAPKLSALRLAGLCAAWLFAAGCAFDGALQDGALVSCADGGACPQGYECQASTSRCVRLGVLDRTPPRVTGQELSPAVARRGDVLTATFTTDEALGSAPAVWLAHGGRSRAFAVRTPATSATTPWTFTYTLGPEDEEGLARVLADVADVQGNQTSGELVGSVALDFTPPAVRQAAVVAPRTGDGGVVSVRGGEAVSVRVTASEWVRDGARLRATPSGCDAGAFDFTATSNTAGLLDFTAAQPGTNGCTYALSLDGLVDVVGNAAQGAFALPAAYRVDTEPPVISALETLGRRDGGLSPQTLFGPVGEAASLTLRFTVDSSTDALVVTLSDVLLPTCTLAACTAVGGGQSCSCERPVTSADREGEPSFVVKALDAAGNESVRSKRVKFDLTAPHIVPETVQLLTPLPAGCPLASASALGATATARLLFSTDEVATASVAAVPGPVLVTPGQGSPTAFTFALTPAPSGQGQGRHSLEATVTDAVGNSATVPLSLSFAIDSVPPAAPDTASDGGVVYRRVPWGLKDAGVSFTVTGQPGRTGPGLTVLALDERSFEVGRATADDAGTFSISLTPVDRPVVFVQAVDDACNKSPAVDVKDVDWVASLQRKVPGSISENPHFAAHHPDFTFALTHPDAVELGPPSGAVLGGYGRQWLGASGPGYSAARAITFDTRRKVAVVVGGGRFTAGVVDGVWEWDGALWRERVQGAHSGAWPTPRGDAALAYDPDRARVVMFGGGGENDETDELWEWDGAQWRQRTPAGPRPGRRIRAGMVYDTQRHRIVMFGGVFRRGWLDDLWEWDGEQWTDRTPSPVPSSGWPPGGPTAPAYDSVRGRVVVFSGDDADRRLWEWDGTSWADRTPSTLPPAWPVGRRNHCAAYDSRRQRVVVFGGETQSTWLNDIWEWDGTTFRLAMPSPLPAGWPTDRRLHACAYDSVRGLTLSVGGDGAERDDDFLGWSGTTLEHLSKHDDRFAPSQRLGASVVYDSARRRVVLFGGSANGFGEFREVWEWTGERWLNRTPTPLPTSWPTAVVGASLSYDSVRGKVLLFSGAAGQANPTRQLWEWDGNTWTNLMPAVVPPAWPSARSFAGAAYDAARRRLVVFGGELGFNNYDDELWEWNGSAWTNRTPSTRPAAWPSGRGGHAFVYDAARSRVVMHGGRWSAYPEDVLSDTWEWDGTSWTNATPSSPNADWPALHSFGASTYDSTRQQVLLFSGNTLLSTGLVDSDELWARVGTAWVPQPGRGGGRDWPGPRALATFAYDSVRDRAFTFGGQQAWSGELSDQREYGQAEGEHPAVVFRFGFDFASAGAGSTVRAVTASFQAGGTGFDETGQGLAGAALHVAEPTGLFPIASSTQSTTSTPGLIEYRAANPAAVAFLGARKELAFALTSRGGSTKLAPSTLMVDDAWVSVAYRRP